MQKPWVFIGAHLTLVSAVFPGLYRFFTYGNFQLEGHLKQIHEEALSKFQRLEQSTAVPAQPHWDKPVSVPPAFIGVSLMPVKWTEAQTDWDCVVLCTVYNDGLGSCPGLHSKLFKTESVIIGKS